MVTSRAWRARALQSILVVVALAGLPAWGSVILNAIRNSQYTPLVAIYLIVYLSILALAVLPRVDDRLRAWALPGLGYANACASFARLGLVGSGRLYLLATPIFATILVGSRAGVVTTAVSLLIYGAFAGVADQGNLESWITVMVNPLSLELWIEAGVALIVFLLSADQFVTVFYGVLNPVTGTLVYCNAGHLPPYRFPFREDGQVQALPITGIPLGILMEQQ